MTKPPPTHGVPAGTPPSAFTKARLYALRKSRELRAERPVFTRIDASMSRSDIKRNLIDVLQRSGFRVVEDPEDT